jgi:hypothetical protein
VKFVPSGKEDWKKPWYFSFNEGWVKENPFLYASHLIPLFLINIKLFLQLL